MTDLEKRADEYADKRAVAYNMPKSSFVIPLLKVAYKTGATQETALLSQHILDLQKDKGNLTDRVRELEKEISVLLSCKNCPENKGGFICQKEYEDKCLAQKIQYIKELKADLDEKENTVHTLDVLHKEAVRKYGEVNDQLTKAKVALRNVIDYLGQFCSDYPDCVIEAEQFLKDSEVKI